MKPTGILGGTFDPVHIGHLRLALELLATLDLAEVRFIPLHEHPFGKKPQANSAQRQQMLELALDNLPGCVLDTRELQRGGLSYTVDTVESLRAEDARRSLCLFLGADAFQQLHRWRRWESLLPNTHIVVVDRPDSQPDMTANDPTINDLIKQYSTDSITALHDSPAGFILHQAIPLLDISATRIRTLIASGNSVRYLVPDSVCDFIRQQRLYEKTS